MLGQCGSRKGGASEHCCGGHGLRDLSLQAITQRGELARPPASPCFQLNGLLAAGPTGEGRPHRQEGPLTLVPGGAWPGDPARPPRA